MKYLLTIFCFAIITLSSCTSDGSENSNNKRLDYNYLGDAFCKCAQPTIQLNEELKLLRKTDKQAFLDKIKEAGNKAKESMNCCKESMKNHTSSTLNPQDLRQALQKECEGLPPQMLDEIVGIIGDN